MKMINIHSKVPIQVEAVAKKIPIDSFSIDIQRNMQTQYFERGINGVEFLSMNMNILPWLCSSMICDYLFGTVSICSELGCGGWDG